jgi:hypothetical protein
MHVLVCFLASFWRTELERALKPGSFPHIRRPQLAFDENAEAPSVDATHFLFEKILKVRVSSSPVLASVLLFLKDSDRVTGMVICRNPQDPPSTRWDFSRGQSEFAHNPDGKLRAIETLKYALMQLAEKSGKSVGISNWFPLLPLTHHCHSFSWIS